MTMQPDSVRSHGRLSREALLFWSIVALQALLPWCFAWFPSCDGPSHVHNAWQLWGWLTGDAQLREYFMLNPRPESNWFGHLLLMVLVHLTNPFIGERLLLAGWFVLFPLSVRYALRALRPTQPQYALAWLALPLAYNWLLHNGFYFNLLSLPAFCAALGWWWPRRHAPGARGLPGLAGWFLLLYFTHVVTFGIAALTFISMLIVESVLPSAAPGNKAPRSLGRLMIALLPAVILTLWVHAGRLSHGTWGEAEVALPKRIVALGTLYYTMVSYSLRELLFGAAIALSTVILTLCAVWRARRELLSATAAPGLLAAALLSTLLFLSAPESLAFGWYLVHRLNLYPNLLLLLWLGTQPLPAVARRLPWVFGMLAGLQLVYFGNIYRGLQPYLNEYVHLGDSIPRGSTLMALGISNRGHDATGKPFAIRSKPFEFGASRIGLARGVIVLNDYQAHIGFFPLSYRPGRNPFEQIGNLLMEPPRYDKGDPLTYPARTGGRVDYILWWQDRATPISPRENAALRAPLDAAYELVAVSEPNGYGRLYKLKGTSQNSFPAASGPDNPRP